MARALILLGAAWLLLGAAPAAAGMAEDARGVGLYGGDWRPNAVHEYWDPGAYHRPETEAVEGRFAGPECAECHSPRFVETLVTSGERTLEIGRMKLREAEAAAAGGAPEAAVAGLLEAMRRVTLPNLRLGIGHQSPDYQWWYGQAALDGDLLRIKAALSDIERRRAVGNGER